MSMASRAFSRLRGSRHVVLDRARGLTTRACSPLPAELVRPAPPSWAVLEGLEPRLLLAGSSLASVLAVYTGELTAPGEQDVIALDLAPGDFAPTRTEATMLGFCLEAVAGSPLNAAVVKASFAGGQCVQARYVEPDLPGTPDSLALYELPHLHTQYDLLVEGDGGTSGGYELSVFLVGDVDGDHDVDSDDTTEMRVCYGTLAPNAPYRAEADANLDGRITSFDMTQHRRNIGAKGHLDYDAPVIHASLANDTGVLADDGETYDATVTGTISDAGTVVSFLAGLDAAPTVDIIGELAGGSFTLTPAEMASIFGGPIGDGPHTLNLQAEDEHANASDVLPLAFTLDTAPPAEPLFDLDPAFDSPPVGDGETTEELVTLAGQTDADTLVELVETGATTASDGAGAFAFADVPLVLGTNSFTVTATDAAGNMSVHDRPIIRLAANTPPTFTSDPVTWAQEGAEYVYDITATDEDDPLTSLRITAAQELPGWLVLTDGGDGTGALVGVPGPADVGAANDVRLAVSDGRGGIDTQEFAITVEPAPQPDFVDPVVTLSVDPNPVPVDDMVTIDLCATDDTAVTDVLLTVAGTPVPVVADPSGQVTMAFGSPGVIEVAVEAWDAAGNVGRAVEELLVVAPGDNTPPTVALTSPADDTAINAITPVTGTASDDQQLLYYTLSVASVSGGEYVEIHRGQSPVSSGLLGSIDPTGLSNDTYRLRLTAVDAGGNSAWVERVVSVTGNQKVGDFRLSFVDMTVPASGIPLTVTRVYDSTTADQSGDFGYGWSLDVKSNIRLRVNRVQGVGWQQVKSGWIIPTYTLLPTVAHTVSIHLPNGRTEVFDLKPVPNSSTLVPVQDTTAAYAPRPGTRGSLVPLGARDLWVMPGGGSTYELVDWGNLMPYDPDRFEYTASDGTKYVISETSGVQRITDRNGNEVTIDSGGIASSAGLAVTFARDAENRITRITDPAGQSVVYAYDSRGDLVSVTDREGNVTRFNYNAYIPHYLEEAIDPLGREGIRTEYDEDGHVVRMTDANGDVVDLTHDVGTSTEIVTDAEGHPTTYQYDLHGNIVSEIDALGNRTTRQFDADDNMLSETIHLNPGTPDETELTTAYTYDDRGNALTETDPLGRTTTYTYNSYGQLLTATNYLGHATANQYDGQGNLETTTDPLGYRKEYTYDGQGNRLSMTDAMGAVTNYQYDAHGRLVSETDPLGKVTTYAYDANGNQTESRREWTDPNDPTHTKVLVEQTQYDSEGRATLRRELVDGALVREISTTYDAAGRVLTATDPLGKVTENLYDATGNLIETRARTEHPDGTPTFLVTRFAYNGNHQAICITDAHTEDDPDANPGPSRGTEIEYDEAGRAITTIRRAGLLVEITGAGQDLSSHVVAHGTELARTRTDYDDADRVIRTVDANGLIAEYEYDDAGRQETAVEAVGLLDARTKYEYMDSGTHPDAVRTVLMQDPLSHETRIEYDALDRAVRTVYDDGTMVSTEYNALEQPVAVTDQAGRITHYEYDAVGNLIAVVLPPVDDTNSGSLTFGQMVHPRYEYDYDRYGNHTVIRDNILQVDPLNPATIVRDHEADGTEDTRETVFTYDPHGRQLTRTLPDGQVESKSYDRHARVDHEISFEGSVTAWEYDSLGRPAAKHFFADEFDYAAWLGNPGLAHEIVAYTHDPFGRQLSVLKDADGDLIGTTADQSAWVYTYGDGLLTCAESPQGVVHYEYDPATDLLVRTFTGDEADPVTDTLYAYDVFGRLETATAVRRHGMLLDDPGTPEDEREVTSYLYDAAGNLDREFLPNGVVADYRYDGLNRLELLRQYSPDATPDDLSDNELIVEFDYILGLDGRRSGVTETRWDGGMPASVTAITWQHDDAGRLIAEEFDFDNDATADKTDAYTYDLVGNRVRKASDNDGDGMFEEVVTYMYDAADRLLTESLAVDGAPARTTTYEYGGPANPGTAQTARVTVDEATGLLIGRTTYGYNLQGRLVRVEVSHHDGAGNEARRETNEYRYDDQGIRVAGSRTVATDHDGDPATALQVENSTETQYLIDAQNHTGYAQVLEETTRDVATGQVVLARAYTIGRDVISQSDAAGPVYVLVYDGHGSTRLLTDSTGAPVADSRYDYDAYGSLLAHSDAPLTRLLYAGEQRDGSTGLDYLRARYMAPALGRFTRMDPFGGVRAVPISLHNYIYAGSNPVSFTDPSGRFLLGYTLMDLTAAVSIRMILQLMMPTFITGGIILSGVILMKPGFEARNLAFELIMKGDPAGIELYQKAGQYIYRISRLTEATVKLADTLMLLAGMVSLASARAKVIPVGVLSVEMSATRATLVRRAGKIIVQLERTVVSWREPVILKDISQLVYDWFSFAVKFFGQVQAWWLSREPIE